MRVPASAAMMLVGLPERDKQEVLATIVAYEAEVVNP